MTTTHTPGNAEPMTMKTLRFGIEIETIGNRPAIARAIQTIVGGTIRQTPWSYDAQCVTDRRGRVWKVMTDSSIAAHPQQQAEVVSPILTYGDMDELQTIVRAIRATGAKVDTSCGIHIHVDAARFSAKAVRNLVKIVNKQESLIEHALGISENRLGFYCRGIDQSFLAKVEERPPRDLDELNVAWYGFHNRRPDHYDGTRYRGLNLHNIWFRGTIEYRYFDSTLHAGKIKAYLQFVLALSAKAIAAKAASSKKRTLNPATAKYDFRVFLLTLGLIGDEFKTARKHLMAGLAGSAAWKNGRPQT